MSQRDSAMPFSICSQQYVSAVMFLILFGLNNNNDLSNPPLCAYAILVAPSFYLHNFIYTILYILSFM